MNCISFRSVIMTFFGSNLIYVSFHLSSQIRSSFAFRFIDSVNLVLAAIFGFIFIISFVILLTLAETLNPTLKVSNQDTVEIIEAKKREIIRMRHTDMNMVIFNGIKCVLYGFIHGYFIDQNELQYILLIIVKIWLLVINVRWSFLFEHKVLCVTSFIYYFAGVIIDSLCLMDKIGIIPGGLFKKMFNQYSGLNSA